MFLFRFRWDKKTRTVCDNDAGPVDGNNVVLLGELGGLTSLYGLGELRAAFV